MRQEADHQGREGTAPKGHSLEEAIVGKTEIILAAYALLDSSISTSSFQVNGDIVNPVKTETKDRTAQKTGADAQAAPNQSRSGIEVTRMSNAAVAIIIETPKESRLKFKLDPPTGSYKVDRVLPKGLRFPFNFGFIPQTRAEDGDPTDVLLILDEILFPGCRMDCQLLGVVRAEQTERGEKYRNDRIVAVPIKDADAPRSLNELERNFIAHVERFFASYHEAEGNTFRVLGLGDPDEAYDLVQRTTVE